MLLKHFNCVSRSSLSWATKRESRSAEELGLKLVPFPPLEVASKSKLFSFAQMLFREGTRVLVG